jgi:hypothetical protein
MPRTEMTIARWFAIVILAALLQWQRAGDVIPMPASVYTALVGGASVVNLAHSIYLFCAAVCPAYYKYLTVGLDLIFLTGAIRYSGFNESPYFYVYFLLLVSNCIRYGLVMSLYIAALVNVLYVIALSLAPTLKPTVLGGEGLKILAFWGVALYGGAVSARIRRQAFEIAAYEETVAELKEELHKLRATSTRDDGGMTNGA